MVSLKEKLEKIDAQFEKETISLKRARDLFFEAKKECSKENVGVDNEEEIDLLVGIFFRFAKVNRVFVENWQAERINFPADEELSLLEENIEMILEIAKDLYEEKKFISEDFYLKVKMDMENSEKFVKQEKNYYQRYRDAASFAHGNSRAGVARQWFYLDQNY